MGNSFVCLNESEWTPLKEDPEVDDSYKQAVETANSTRSIMSDNGDCLNERGERLSVVDAKCDTLVEKTSEFTSLAKQLKMKLEEKNNRKYSARLVGTLKNDC